MTANEVIECYVSDVAVQLPRKQRNDVAFELRALLGEELQARAADTGRAPDAAMALELLRGFGRPVDVASRYRPTLTVIDPVDGYSFVRALWIGLAVIWSMGLLGALSRMPETASELLQVLGQWLAQSVFGALWWPGLLVLCFGAGAWSRRRGPASNEWQPLAPDRIVGSRVGLVLGIVGILAGLYLLVEPRWVLDFFWGGRAAPVAYEALTYTESFRELRGPVLYTLLALNVPLLLAVLITGRWTPRLRRLEMAHSVAVILAMAWVIFGGPIFMTPHSDLFTKALMFVILVGCLLYLGVTAYRQVRPTPSLA